MKLVEREISEGGRAVPLAVWLPESAGQARPLVLIGHGGSQHKTAERVAHVAAAFVNRLGCVAAAIDGPVHGARRAAPLAGIPMQTEFLTMWREDHRIDSMIADWRLALDALCRMPEVDAGRVAWFGLSMGTAYGLPLAAHEPRIQAAVLGMWGTSYPNSERLAQDAPKVTCPALFLQKWHDEIFTRESQIALFDAIGSAEKWLKVSMGPHASGEEQIDDAVQFIGKYVGSGKAAG